MHEIKKIENEINRVSRMLLSARKKDAAMSWSEDTHDNYILHLEKLEEELASLLDDKGM
jgi:hypothetical protein